MRRFCVIDTETGGIGAEAAQNWSIVQLGAVVYNDGLMPGREHSFECVIQEEYPLYQPEAMKVNGFTQDRIDLEGIHPGLAVARFILWLHKSFFPGEKVTLCGHNVGYDVSFLQRLFKLAGCLEAYDDIFNYRTIDTATIARFLIDAGIVPLQDPKSNSLFEHFGCTPAKPHDALSDAIATGHLYTKMLGLMQRAVITSAPYYATKEGPIAQRVGSGDCGGVTPRTTILRG